MKTNKEDYRSRQYYESKVLQNTEVNWFSTAHTDPEWNCLVQKLLNLKNMLKKQ